MIMETTLISDTNPQRMSESVQEAVESMQAKGYRVEIQYSSHFDNVDKVNVLSAFVIGRDESLIVKK